MTALSLSSPAPVAPRDWDAEALAWLQRVQDCKSLDDALALGPEVMRWRDEGAPPALVQSVQKALAVARRKLGEPE